MAVNILVVEDESIVRKDIERSLEKLGYHVIAQADNGERAIELARATKPDIALMDIQIKGNMTGIKEIDLHTTIEMAIHKHGKEKEVRVENELLRSLTSFKSNANYLFIKHQSKLVKVNTSDIYYVEALKDYMQIVTSDVKYTIHATMKDIERKLPKTVFQRLHRSYIVNMDKIASISGGDVILADINKEIPVGGNYRDEFGERINIL